MATTMTPDEIESYKVGYTLGLKDIMADMYNPSSVPTDEDVYNSIKDKLLFNVDLEVVQKLIQEHARSLHLMQSYLTFN
jgi:hypothetical protein